MVKSRKWKDWSIEKRVEWLHEMSVILSLGYIALAVMWVLEVTLC